MDSFKGSSSRWRGPGYRLRMAKELQAPLRTSFQTAKDNADIGLGGGGGGTPPGVHVFQVTVADAPLWSSWQDAMGYDSVGGDSGPVGSVDNPIAIPSPDFPEAVDFYGCRSAHPYADPPGNEVFAESRLFLYATGGGDAANIPVGPLAVNINGTSFQFTNTGGDSSHKFYDADDIQAVGEAFRALVGQTIPLWIAVA